MTIQVGAIQDGKQSLTIGNSIDGRYKTVISTPEKVDEFVKTYDNMEKKSHIKGLVLAGISTLVGAVAGFLSKADDLPRTKALCGGALGLAIGGVLSFIPMLVAGHKQQKLAEKFIAENE